MGHWQYGGCKGCSRGAGTAAPQTGEAESERHQVTSASQHSIPVPAGRSLWPGETLLHLCQVEPESTLRCSCCLWGWAGSADTPLPLSFLPLGRLSSASLLKAPLFSLKGSEACSVVQSFTTKRERGSVLLSALTWPLCCPKTLQKAFLKSILKSPQHADALHPSFLCAEPPVTSLLHRQLCISPRLHSYSRGLEVNLELELLRGGSEVAPAPSAGDSSSRQEGCDLPPQRPPRLPPQDAAPSPPRSPRARLRTRCGAAPRPLRWAPGRALPRVSSSVELGALKPIERRNAPGRAAPTQPHGPAGSGTTAAPGPRRERRAKRPIAALERPPPGLWALGLVSRAAVAMEIAKFECFPVGLKVCHSRTPYEEAIPAAPSNWLSPLSGSLIGQSSCYAFLSRLVIGQSAPLRRMCCPPFPQRPNAVLGEAPRTPASYWLFLLLSAAHWLVGVSVAVGRGRRAEGVLAATVPPAAPAAPPWAPPPPSPARRPASGLASLASGSPPAAATAAAAEAPARPAAEEDEGDRGLRGVPEGLAALQVLPERSRAGVLAGDRPRWSGRVLGTAQGGLQEGWGVCKVTGRTAWWGRAAGASRAAGTGVVGALEGGGELRAAGCEESGRLGPELLRKGG